MSHPPMTLQLALALAALDSAHHKHVRFLDPSTGEERSGTVRGFRADSDSDNHPRTGQDIRDTCVRVTLDSGWEAWYATPRFALLFVTGSAMVTA